MYPDEHQSNIGKRRIKGVSHTSANDQTACAYLLSIPVLLGVFGCLLMLLINLFILWQERAISGISFNYFIGLSAVVVLSMLLIIRVVWQAIRPKRINITEVEKQKLSAKKKKRKSKSFQHLALEDDTPSESGDRHDDGQHHPPEQRR